MFSREENAKLTESLIPLTPSRDANSSRRSEQPILRELRRGLLTFLPRVRVRRKRRGCRLGVDPPRFRWFLGRASTLGSPDRRFQDISFIVSERNQDSSSLPPRLSRRTRYSGGGGGFRAAYPDLSGGDLQLQQVLGSHPRRSLVPIAISGHAVPAGLGISRRVLCHVAVSRNLLSFPLARTLVQVPG